jgi:hypothetical protein
MGIMDLSAGSTAIEDGRDTGILRHDMDVQEAAPVNEGTNTPVLGHRTVAETPVATRPTMGSIAILDLNNDHVTGRREQPAPLACVRRAEQTARRTAGDNEGQENTTGAPARTVAETPENQAFAVTFL